MLCANTSEVCIGGRGMNVPVLPEVTRLCGEMRGFVHKRLISILAMGGLNRFWRACEIYKFWSGNIRISLLICAT